MEISLRQLQVFLAVADSGGFTRAAQTLNVSQPAVTKTIRDMEAALGVTLFERLPRGCLLTDAGEVLARHGRSITAELRQADNELAAVAGPGTGSLKVGTPPIGAVDYVPRAILRTLAAFPGLSVSIFENLYAELLPALREGDLDVVFGPLAGDAREGFSTEVLFHDDFSIVARAHHPLAAKASVDFTDLAQYDWVLPPKGVPPRRLYEGVIRAAGYDPPQYGIETSSTAAIRAILLESDRVTLLPRSVLRTDIDNGLIAVLPIELRGSARPIGLMYRIGSEASPQAAAFATAIREIVAESTHAPLQS